MCALWSNIISDTLACDFCDFSHFDLARTDLRGDCCLNASNNTSVWMLKNVGDFCSFLWIDWLTVTCRKWKASCSRSMRHLVNRLAHWKTNWWRRSGATTMLKLKSANRNRSIVLPFTFTVDYHCHQLWDACIDPAPCLQRSMCLHSLTGWRLVFTKLLQSSLSGMCRPPFPELTGGRGQLTGVFLTSIMVYYLQDNCTDAVEVWLIWGRSCSYTT